MILHPYPKRYENKESGFQYSCTLFIGIQLDVPQEQKNNPIRFGHIIDQFVEGLNQWESCTQGMFIKCSHIKRSKIGELVDFKGYGETVLLNVGDDEDEDNPGNNVDLTQKITEIDETTAVNKPLGSAEDVFNKIMWDPKYESTLFTVGYLDRFTGIMELRFDKFKNNPDQIPFHRIYYFKLNDKIVWDRENKINYI